MKRLLMLVTMIVAALTAAWFAAEPWLVNQAKRQMAQRSDMSVGAIAAMPGASRLGLRASDVEWRAGGVAVAAPLLDLWVTPLAPTTLTAALPRQVEWGDDLQHMLLGIDRGRAALRPSLRNGQVRHARIDFAGLTLDGQPLAGQGQILARLADAGDMPGAQSAYDIDLAIAPVAGFGTVPGMTGQTRIWLDRALDADWAASGQGLHPLALRSDGLTLTMGDLTMRMLADLRADADGRISGRMAIYTTDAGAVLDMAVQAGILPPNVRVLARTMLNRIGRMPFATAPAPDEMAFPEPAEAMLRLPLQAREGRLFLGPIEVGPAPMLAMPQP